MFSESERDILRKAQSIKRKARQKAKADRPKNPKASRGRVRNNAYLAWLRRQPCALYTPSVCLGPTEAAHVRSHMPGEPPTGLQRKPDDRRANPLCQWHHRQQHTMNELHFWWTYGRDPFVEATANYSRFLAEGAK